MTALLEARIGVARGDWNLDIDIQAERGTVTALLGPNGAGKTTTVHALAGLHPIDKGNVLLAGRELDDAESGLRLPPQERAVGMVFQDYLLFPRLTACANVAFGLRARGVDKATATAKSREWLARMQLAEHADRRPAELSGGQAQRVALARALAVEPALLLLDEPLAALDAGTRMTVRGELRAHLAEFGGATIIVTHDPLDALVLADRIVVLEQGRVVQAGTPAEVARHPRTRYVAQLVGLNLLKGKASGETVTLEHGTTLALAEPSEGPVFVVARPSAIGVYRDRPHGSPRNSWQAVVAGVEQHGHAVRLDTKGPPDVVVDVTADAVADLNLVVGAAVWLNVKATDLVVYAA